MIDYHIHLEEGPYNAKFLNRTLETINYFNSFKLTSNKKDFEQIVRILNERFQQGDYSKYWLDYYLNVAKKLNLKQVGIVDHLYRFYEFKDYFEQNMDISSDEIGAEQKRWLENVMVKNINDFIDFIKSQKEHWKASGIELRVGLEVDYFLDSENYLKKELEQLDVDYFIGSVHFYRGWGFDNPDLKEKYNELDIDEVYKEHFATVESAAKSNLFHIIAHVDNIKVFGNRCNPELQLKLNQSLVKSLFEADVATEINVGLEYRYPVKEQCPSNDIIEELINKKVPITLSSDAHFPQDIGKYNEKWFDYLKNNNVQEVATFKNKIREMKDITSFKL